MVRGSWFGHCLRVPRDLRDLRGSGLRGPGVPCSIQQREVSMKSFSFALLLLVVSAIGIGAQGGRGFGGPPANPVGKWTGTWYAFNPAEGATPPKEQCKSLNAEITKEGEV